MRGYNIDDYIDVRFNHLTLIKNLNIRDKRNSKLALFKCDCGKEKVLVFTQVFSNKVRSCGCLQGSLSKENKQQKQNSLLSTYSCKTMKNNRTGYTRNIKIKRQIQS